MRERMGRILWLVIAVLVLGGAYAAAYRSAQPHGTAEGQVRGAIFDALDALQNGNTSGAMSVISPEYKDSTGVNRDQLYLLARRAAENRRDWSANIQDMRMDIQGDEAIVHIGVAVRRTSDNSVVVRPIDLHMRWEKTHVYGVIPTMRWRVVSASDIPTEDTLWGE